jgi:hypothetical protein
MSTFHGTALPTSKDGTSGASARPDVVTVTAMGAGGVVALVAALGSYRHMHDLALAAGQGWLSTLLPLSVDGMVVAASMTLVAAKRRGEDAGLVPPSALALGLLVSITANVLSAGHDLPAGTAELIAAWPPVALAVSYELVMRSIGRRPSRRAEPESDPQVDSSVPVEVKADSPAADVPVTGSVEVEASAEERLGTDTVPVSVESAEDRTATLVALLERGEQLTGASAAALLDVSERTGRRELRRAETRLAECRAGALRLVGGR